MQGRAGALDGGGRSACPRLTVPDEHDVSAAGSEASACVSLVLKPEGISCGPRFSVAAAAVFWSACVTVGQAK
jgi:hypothetical protein